MLVTIDPLRTVVADAEIWAMRVLQESSCLADRVQTVLELDIIRTVTNRDDGRIG